MTRLRKVQLTGASTFIISLPKSWAKKNNVGRGSELSIEEAGSGSLVIRQSGFKPKEARTILNISSATKMVDLERALVSAYLNGFTTIEIAASHTLPRQMKRDLEGILKRMTGFEITEEKPERLLLQDFFSDKAFSFERTLRRCHSISMRMQEDLWLAIEQKDTAMLKAVLELETEIDRLSFLAKRQLRSAVSRPYLLETFNFKQNQLVEYYLVFEMEERISDRLSDSAEELLNMPDAFPSSEATAILKEAHEFTLSHHKAALKAFFESDSAAANRLIDSVSEFRRKRTERMRRLLATKGPKSTSSILMTRFGEVARLSGDICEAVLDIPHENPLEISV
ncbi:MAG: phosphate uptake regulator PhoU [Candidatus Micrarchaeia archaeon]